MKILATLISVIVMFLTLSGPAYAYLDPVTGSLIIQGVIAFVAAAMASIKSVRIKIAMLFARMRK